MTIAQRIATVSANAATATRAGEFVELARQLLIARGDLIVAAQNAANDRHSNIATVLKSAVQAGSLTNYGAIAQYPVFGLRLIWTAYGITVLFDRLASHP